MKIEYVLGQKKNLELAGKIITLMRESGLPITSPYDVENWATEWLTCHSNLFLTKQFKEE